MNLLTKTKVLDTSLFKIDWIEFTQYRQYFSHVTAVLFKKLGDAMMTSPLGHSGFWLTVYREMSLKWISLTTSKCKYLHVHLSNLYSKLQYGKVPTNY